MDPGREVPPYLRRKGFVPRKPGDFGGGGAFPEIHLAQYPLDMGRNPNPQGSKQLAVSLNESGQLNFDAVLRQGANRGKIIHSDHMALVPKLERMTTEALARPSEEDVDKTTKETQEYLERLVTNKLSSVNPSTLPDQPGHATLIKYTPAQQGAQFASGAGQRIIKMQDMPVDPLEPPKFRHIKAPRGPGSPPVPVMHSPPRQLTVKDQQDWKIPPCISNWKNAKGYTIPLDKRLAADGRGLQQSQINDKFASLSEALFTAEAKAREAIQMRSAVVKELQAKEKSRKEAELRQLAMQARMERTGGIAERAAPGRPGAAPAAAGSFPPPPPPPGAGSRPSAMDLPGPPSRGGGRGDDHERDRAHGRGDDDYGRDADRRRRDDVDETAEEREERRRRDEIREERRRERERERRLEASGAASKKSKITRDRERDISEKVALGMANVGAQEVAYDQRLFNQDAGLTSGFGADDAYAAYDKPLWADRGSNQFRPTRAADDDDDGDRAKTFRPDKGFAGADGGPSAASGGGRGAGRLEFERAPAAAAAAAAQEEDDPFGLNGFLQEVKGGKKKGALDGIGKGGGMRAAAGGAAFTEDSATLGSRRMHFTAASGR